MNAYWPFAVILGVAAVSSYTLTWVVRKLSVKLHLVVKPDERRVHENPTPTAGGGAMFLAFLLAMGVAGVMPQFHEAFRSSDPLAIVLGAAIIFAVGLGDDLREMSAPAKLSGQVFAGSVLALLGVSMFFLQVPFAGVLVLSPDLQPLLTVLWVAGMANAVNLIDGLDGLAAGIVAIASGSFFIYGDRLSRQGFISPNNVGVLVAVATCGICIGFLPHNFHRARIFMGDAGAMLLGLLMAASTLEVVGQADAEFTGKTFFFFAPIFIPFFILGVPMLDTAFAILRRAAGRSGVAHADREHLHYRLERMGHGHRRSVLILWAWTVILCGLSLYPAFTNRGNAVVPFLIAALGVALYTLFHPGIRRAAADPPKDGATVIHLGQRKRRTG
ncbi:MAG: UDP-GlcNAc:undecaprenyl-phosphate/decaprenyl-phosphate GlcNAc-phosphate transferase [Acidimicrobiaceae bacterium]|nr:UDP-GlcNAc:undecaprenyl-phosphate/decaprenyl-phosphate GlcNAc-phosphate transferase [Acidimicrobiaceae bacterium]